MNEFFSNYLREIIATGVMMLTLSVLRYIIIQLIKKYAIKSEVIEYRKNLVIKYISVFITSLFFIGLIMIWGVKTDDLFVTISSVLTVIGVALFAQWSILSNITSGFIVLFSFPFKIGDSIRIHDKDFPIEGEIISIHTFYTLVKTLDGDLVTYPNSLFLQKGISTNKRPNHHSSN
ncbi:mechanosensitive ion channel family protein [Flavobacterium tegetincola]|uniref:mechanosensitive ion channel family protein n=1 Tax=Flavobacterium tegetincola TaxID=150172 RepID=UPI000410646B|nr:mechanosensitive ion channel family protein [Flavobacterium tegetincola]